MQSGALTAHATGLAHMTWAREEQRNNYKEVAQQGGLFLLSEWFFRTDKGNLHDSDRQTAWPLSRVVALSGAAWCE